MVEPPAEMIQPSSRTASAVQKKKGTSKRVLIRPSASKPAQDSSQVSSPTGQIGRLLNNDDDGRKTRLSEQDQALFSQKEKTHHHKILSDAIEELQHRIKTEISYHSAELQYRWDAERSKLVEKAKVRNCYRILISN